jgi:hypothetical protein
MNTRHLEVWMRSPLFAAAVVLAAAVPALAQSPAAPASPAATPRPRDPRETVSATLDGKKVAVEYGRPSLRGRAMADLLSQLPADRIWRAGVDQVTTLTTEADVHAPASGEYSLILNSDKGVPLKTIFPAAPPALADAPWPRLQDYASVLDKEVLRVPLRRAAAAEAMDRFLIALAPAVNGKSSITLTWGGESWTTDLAPAPVVQ